MNRDYPLKALILTGGKSSRMGEDKASLMLNGQTLLERIDILLREFTNEIYLSVAHDAPCEENSEFTLLPDLEPSPGPLGGLQAAFTHDSSSHWLVLAIDLPRLSRSDLAQLLDAHDVAKNVTCFLNPLDGHPEPLCALYSPSAAPKLEEGIRENRRCARRFLLTLKRTEISPEDPQALLNLNRPEHLAELEQLHQNGAVKKELTIEYFAKLSQEAGATLETVHTSTATLTGLWEEVRLRHHFTLDLPEVKPALNDSFADWETPLTSGDRVAFMPPFAGG